MTKLPMATALWYGVACYETLWSTQETEFQNLETCFDIAHSDIGKQLWGHTASLSDATQQQKYLVKTSYPVYAKLQEEHSLLTKISHEQKHSKATADPKADDYNKTNMEDEN